MLTVIVGFEGTLSSQVAWPLASRRGRCRRPSRSCRRIAAPASPARSSAATPASRAGRSILSCCSTCANCTSCWVNWLVSSGSSGFWFLSCVVSSVRKVWKLPAMVWSVVDASVEPPGDGSTSAMACVPETTGACGGCACRHVVSSDPDVDAAARHRACGRRIVAGDRGGDGVVLADRPAAAAGRWSGCRCLFWPDCDWSRRLNCRPPLPVFRPASLQRALKLRRVAAQQIERLRLLDRRREVTWPLRSTSSRTSMRPSSGGSSRISKRFLPLCAVAAISTASPLTGTAAPVAASR